MPKTITLDTTNIVDMRVHPGQQAVVVTYTLSNEDGTITQTASKTFWFEIPDTGLDGEGNKVPTPQDWVQLPTKSKNGLKDLLTYIVGKVDDEVK